MRSPSIAARGPHAAQPWRNSLESAVMPPVAAVASPIAAAIVGASASLVIRAVPVSAKSRWSGSVNSRAIACSGSLRGGTGRMRSRLISTTSGWLVDDGPVAASRSDGIRTTSRTRTGVPVLASATRTSANPTALALPASRRFPRLLPVTAISSRRKCRGANEMVWPVAVRDDASSSASTGLPPSKRSCTLVM